MHNNNNNTRVKLYKALLYFLLALAVFPIGVVRWLTEPDHYGAKPNLLHPTVDMPDWVLPVTLLVQCAAILFLIYSYFYGPKK